MENDIKGELESSIQARIEADAEFQSSLEELQDDEKETKVKERHDKEFNDELKRLKENADKATKAEELANNYKARAEKAEKGAKTPDKKPVELSQSDLIALARTDLVDDDIEEVKRFAAYQGVSVSDALKNKTMKSILNEREEERRSALATSTGKSQRGTGKVSDDDIVNKAEKGETLESDEDMQKLFRGRQARRKGK